MKHIATKYPRITTLKTKEGIEVKVNKPELNIIVLLWENKTIPYYKDRLDFLESVAHKFYPDLFVKDREGYITYNHDEIHRRVYRLLKRLMEVWVVKMCSTPFANKSFILTNVWLSLYSERYR